MRTATCFALTTLLLYLGEVRPAPVINTPWGQIQGSDGVSPGGSPYSVYHRIPYALSPVGERRFAKPLAHPGPGVGRVFNATSPGYICPQKGQLGEEQKTLMNEDCLTLNVYVPSSSASAGLKSVMIWIHGGGFTEGSALEYTPSDLVTSRDVIVVVIQYRLDVLGFLASGDDVIRGNYGLWDQALAVQWVKDNVQAFGGDPNSLTLFGESAGSASVGYQVLTPVNKGIDFRAIMQSGTPLSPWAFSQDPGRVFRALANLTGCLSPTNWASSVYYTVAGGRQRAEHESVLRCLRAKDADTLIQALEFLPDPDGTSNVLTQIRWVPVVDGEFLPRPPADLLRDVNYLADVGAAWRDVMVGVNNEEGGLLLGLPAYLEQTYTDEDVKELLKETRLDGDLAQAILKEDVLLHYGNEGLGQDHARLDTLVQVLEFFYKQPANNGGVGMAMTGQGVLDVFSDIFFVVPSVRFLRDLTRASDLLRSQGRLPPSSSSSSFLGDGRRYFYLFNHYPAPGRGLYHGEDIAYEFDRNEAFGQSYAFGVDDLTLATTFKSMVSNFAKSGAPQVMVNQQSGSSWPQFSLSEENYLSLEAVPRVANNLYSQRVALWMDLLPSLVNSTRTINSGRLSLPWQQQQTYSLQGHSGYSYGLMNQLPMRFIFKGRISFFKLH